MKVIHHRNGDPRDNRPENLIIIDSEDAGRVAVPLVSYLSARARALEAERSSEAERARLAAAEIAARDSDRALFEQLGAERGMDDMASIVEGRAPAVLTTKQDARILVATALMGVAVALFVAVCALVRP